jgi:hypothetical protein
LPTALSVGGSKIEDFLNRQGETIQEAQASILQQSQYHFSLTEVAHSRIDLFPARYINVRKIATPFYEDGMNAGIFILHISNKIGSIVDERIPPAVLTGTREIAGCFVALAAGRDDDVIDEWNDSRSFLFCSVAFESNVRMTNRNFFRIIFRNPIVSGYSIVEKSGGSSLSLVIAMIRSKRFSPSHK